MNKTLKVLFATRKPSGYKGGPLPIYIRITVDGERVEMNSQRKCEPEKWNDSAGRAYGKTESIRELNAYLDTLQSKIFQIHRELITKDAEVRADKIRDILQGKHEKKITLIRVYTDHIAEVASLVGKDYAAGTLKRFKAAFSSLQAFLKHKGKSDLTLNELNFTFLSEYEHFLKTVRDIEHNTAMGILKKLKKIVRLCVANEWMERDPFLNYKMKIRETNRAYLIQDELNRIIEKEFSTPRLAHTKDVFIFCCYTGLSFSDVKSLKRIELVEIDGKKWIHNKRQKTGNATRIPLLPAAVDIIRKYEHHPQAAETVLPVMSNQKMNEYLKEIAERCGIHKPLTLHVARHTFATTVTLTNGVPIETVSKMLGHRSIRTTQQYAKVVDSKVAQDMGALEKRLALRHADASARPV